MEAKELSHIDAHGKAQMVDVSAKQDTERTALAAGEILLSVSTLDLVKKGYSKKGDVLMVAQLAGIMAAKKTHELIPLCHPLVLTKVDLDLQIDDKIPGIRITAFAKAIGKTGVEMEALMAVSVAALTIYDMVKAVERTAEINNIHLVEKHGGQSGDLYNL
jgi:cyclic pyranopterin monophosphate synthase